ncbi:DUF2802 domain-containing protein [Alteromonadaceae bacterium BrNp21-10]|nr:DUF2802 domain-containing protein [Alteromonadaceae bacterium BrNp21-10]
MTYQSALLIVSCILAISVCGWLVVRLSSRVESLSKKTAEQNKQLLELRSEVQALQDALHEIRAGSLGVGQKVRDLVSQLQETKAAQDELKGTEPESKLYGVATKMAKQGASVDEIMQECELPRAEAELLVQLHQ